MMIDPKICVDG